MDGQTLTESLHTRGINVRYLGRIANHIKDIPTLPYLYVSTSVYILYTDTYVSSMYCYIVFLVKLSTLALQISNFFYLILIMELLANTT